MTARPQPDNDKFNRDLEDADEKAIPSQEGVHVVGGS
jgi:hypothetical protein